MEVRKDWGVLISQTGSEIIAIGKEIGYLPSLIVTNNIDKIPERNMEILRENNIAVSVIPFKPTVDDYLRSGILDKQLITLHGFLRIVPVEFFNHYQGSIFNGHPALITKYPELKGYNKQEDIFINKEKYPTCGSVIHEVIPELDSGQIVASVETRNIAEDINHAYALLRRTSLESWKYFFKEIWKFN